MTQSARLSPFGVVAFLIFALGLALIWGPITLHVSDLWHVLIGDGTALHRTVVLQVRLPRALLAAIVGGNLAVSGVLLQSALRNPLGDPHLVGISSGAGLGAVLAFMFFPMNFSVLSGFAFLGAILSCAAVYLLAYQTGASPVRLILAGVAITSLLGALTNALLSFSGMSVQIALSWLAGGFSGRSWAELNLVLPWTAVGILGALWMSRMMNVLALGDQTASALGLSVDRVRLLLLVLGALLAGSSVAVSGVIGFVGLMVPHIVRLLVGHDHMRCVPLAFGLGAALLCLADTLARNLLDPVELPVGVFTAALGVPYFLQMLRGRR